MQKEVNITGECFCGEFKPAEFNWLSGKDLLTSYVGSKASWEIMPEGVLQYSEGAL